jgi:hypothetical protein
MGAVTIMNDPMLLTCWKDIARYMGKGVRTVQRWEQKLDLPVRRPQGAVYKSAVVARPKDLDAWLASRWSSRSRLASSNPREISNFKTDTSSIVQAIGTSIHRLGSTIQTGRQLRAEHQALLEEMSSTLSTLIQNCREMREQPRNGLQ